MVEPIKLYKKKKQKKPKVQPSCPTRQLGESARIILKSTQKHWGLRKAWQEKADGTIFGLIHRQIPKETGLQFTLFYNYINVIGHSSFCGEDE